MSPQPNDQARLQEQINELKRELREMQDVLRDIIAQLRAKRLYRPPG